MSNGRAAVQTVNSGFRKNIAGLRAVAIVAVVFFHVQPGLLPSGFIGVDIFFVLSGYLIVGLLWKELAHQQYIDWRGFYARRARRLLPAALFLVAAVTTAGSLLLPFWQLDHLLWQAAAGVGFFANIFFFQQPSGYFADSASNPEPLLHMWTLSLEEQFYFIAPLLLAGVSVFLKANKKAVVWLLSTVTVASFVAAVFLSPAWERSSFYLIHTRAWEFALGGLVAVILSSRAGIPRVLTGIGGQVSSILGFCLLFIALFAITPDIVWPGWWTLVPTIGTVLVLASSEDTVVGKILSNRLMVGIGAISYSWYLWHYPPLVLVERTNFESTGLWYVAVVCIGLLGAIISYFLIEKPFRRIALPSRSSVRRTVTLGATAVLTFTGLLSTAAIGVERYKDNRVSEPVHEVSDITSAELEDALSVPDDGQADSHEPGKSGVIAMEEPEPAAITSLAGREVLLVGDSHSVHWEEAFRHVVEDELGGSLRMHSLLSCPAINVYVTKLDGSAMRSGCEEHREAFWEAAASADIVILSQAEHYINRIRGEERERLEPAMRVALWTQAYEEWLLRANELNALVAVIEDNPIMPGNPAQCARYSNDLSECNASVSTVLESMGGIPEASDEVRQRLLDKPEVQTWSAFDRICGEGICAAVNNGIPVFSDNQHLSQEWTIHQAPHLEKWLLGLVNEWPDKKDTLDITD